MRNIHGCHPLVPGKSMECCLQRTRTVGERRADEDHDECGDDARDPPLPRRGWLPLLSDEAMAERERRVEHRVLLLLNRAEGEAGDDVALLDPAFTLGH